MRPEDIKDRESLKAWLESLPIGRKAERDGLHRLAVAIAHHSAMPLALRVVLDGSQPEQESTALSVFRRCVISGVAAVNSIPEFTSNAVRHVSGATADASAKAAAATGEAGATAYAAAAASAANSAACAASARAIASNAAEAGAYKAAGRAAAARAADAHGADTRSYAADAAAYASAAANINAASSFWAALRTDCAAWQEGRPLEALRLWPDDDPFRELWAERREALLAEDAGWAFWAEWYDRSAAGDQQDWAGLLRDVARIPQKDWNKGADHVNALIADIRARYAIANSYNAERVTRDPDDQLFRADPITGLPERVLRDAIERVRDVVAEIRTAMSRSNAYAALQVDLDRIDDYLTRYPGNPLRLHEVFVKSIRHVDAMIADGICPTGDMLIEDYRADLDASAIDIRESDAEVRQTLTRRARARFERLNPEERAQLNELTEAVRLESRPQFAEELRRLRDGNE